MNGIQAADTVVCCIPVASSHERQSSLFRGPGSHSYIHHQTIRLYVSSSSIPNSQEKATLYTAWKSELMTNALRLRKVEHHSAYLCQPRRRCFIDTVTLSRDAIESVRRPAQYLMIATHQDLRLSSQLLGLFVGYHRFDRSQKYPACSCCPAPPE